jgi:flagellar basal-body rod modification protein FlgD
MSTTSAINTQKSYLASENPFANRAATSSSSSSSSSTSASSSDASAATKDMFLKLLVTQLKNQDPLNPSDGTQFVAQLAQFTELEQVISMNAELGSVKTDLESAFGVSTSSGTSSST